MASPSKSVVVNDFFSTIEEAGISDIAAEVGIIPRSGPASSPVPASREAETEGAPSCSNGAPSSSVSASGWASPRTMPPLSPCPPSTPEPPRRAPAALPSPAPCGAGSRHEASGSYVNVSYTGPQVPDGLASTLAGVGEPAAKKKRMQRAHGGKAGDKGLRHFSMKVCEKVEQKGKTTYNEVADELVAEFAVDAETGASALDQAYDEKNIRRRVYDALNVLMVRRAPPSRLF